MDTCELEGAAGGMITLRTVKHNHEFELMFYAF